MEQLSKNQNKLMSAQNFLQNYLKSYNSLINDSAVIDELIKIRTLFQNASKEGKKVILAGNGGSAAMASHVSVDITKNAGIRAMTFNEYDLITTLANDYGYENWISKGIELYYDPITFSGFNKDNPLKKVGDINLWVDAQIYNIVEMTHHIWLLAIVDMIISENN